MTIFQICLHSACKYHTRATIKFIRIGHDDVRRTSILYEMAV